MKSLELKETITTKVYTLNTNNDFLIIEIVINTDDTGWNTYSINILSQEKTSEFLADSLYYDNVDFWTENNILTIDCRTLENQSKVFKQLVNDLKDI